MSQVSTVDLGQDLVPVKYFYLLKNWVLSFCHKGEVHTHWIFVSEKQTNKSDIHIEYVCQKQNTQKSVFLRNLLSETTSSDSWGSYRKNSVLQLSQYVVNLSENQLLCNLHD
jgi:hypothetical protein